jgi:hypothetical protein
MTPAALLSRARRVSRHSVVAAVLSVLYLGSVAAAMVYLITAFFAEVK